VQFATCSRVVVTPTLVRPFYNGAFSIASKNVVDDQNLLLAPDFILTQKCYLYVYCCAEKSHTPIFRSVKLVYIGADFLFVCVKQLFHFPNNKSNSDNLTDSL
jgi:hypothetical protein